MATAATLYAAHLPTAGVPCSLQFFGESLHLSADSGAQHIAARGLKLSKGGFNDDGLFVEWADGDVRYSAMITQPEHARALLAAAPLSLAAQTAKFKKSLSSQQFKWGMVVGTLSFLAVLVVGVVVFSRQTESWLAAQVPQKWEEKMAAATLKQLKEDGKLTQKGAAALAVAEIGGKLTKGSRYKYQWFVKDDPSINAFAVPGGVVVVHSGLIAKASSPEELAGVLAHEVQHVELRHSLQGIIHTAGWGALLAVTLGDVSAIAGVLVHQAGNLKHSRDLETQADLEGLIALRRAGIKPQGMASFFSKLAAEHRGDDDIALLSTHPPSAERQAALAALIKKDPCTACKPLVMDWLAVQNSLPKDDSAPEKPKITESSTESSTETIPGATKNAGKGDNRRPNPAQHP